MSDAIPTEPDLLPWREDEHEIEGGWFGGEFPRLWPPRSAIPGGSCGAEEPA